MFAGVTLAHQRRQAIDESRGPAGNYDAIHKPLPDLPEGVVWQHNSKTREWTLARVDQQEQADRNLYRLQTATAWNPHTGREQLVVKPVPKRDNETVATQGSNDDDDLANMGDDPLSSPPPPPPVLGKDYLVHTVLPSDTFSGLCLRYKIKALTLRQVNQFSGSNLNLAPTELIIPLNKNNMNLVRLQDTTSQEYKLQVVRNECPQLVHVECKAYLEMNDWDLPKTLQEIEKDAEWEQEHGDADGIRVEVARKKKEADVYQPVRVTTK